MHAPAARPQAARERPAVAPRPAAAARDRFYHRARFRRSTAGYAYPAGCIMPWDIGFGCRHTVRAGYYTTLRRSACKGRAGYTGALRPDLPAGQHRLGEVEDVAYGVFL